MIGTTAETAAIEAVAAIATPSAETDAEGATDSVVRTRVMRQSESVPSAQHQLIVSRRSR
jgi:hypothetical protein